MTDSRTLYQEEITPDGRFLISIPIKGERMAPIPDRAGQPFDFAPELKRARGPDAAYAIVARVLQGCGLDITPPRRSRPAQQDLYTRW